MISHKLKHYKDIYLDDGVTGADLDRPGFTAFRRDTTADRSVSHVLIHMTDRFARPELATRAALLEQEMLLAGLTVVFSNRTSLPRRGGELNVGEDLQMMFAYSESGEYLDKLAVRMIQTQANLARKGHWTGGQAPYGFARVRVMADGSVQEMEHGTSIRQPGSHTEIRATDENKIRVWVMALHWCYEKKWGCKRIALELNRLGIPSPDAGRTRTEQGRKHRVSGTWSPSTVRALLRNRAIVAELQYGVQSEGHHRRLGADGSPRLLEDADELDGQPKVIFNSSDIVIRSALPNLEPLIDTQVFEGAQAVLDERGKHQRGIAKIRDSFKYPLSTRVYDLCCGYPMYGRTSGTRRCYTCGRYINSAGEHCEHNQVDAEAALAFVLGVLKQKLIMSGGRAALRERLIEMAKSAREQQADNGTDERKVLTGQLREAEADLKLLTANMGRATDDAAYKAIETIFSNKRLEIDQLQRQLDKLTRGRPRSTGTDGVQNEVDRALALFDEIDVLAADDAAREAMRPLFRRLNLNLWLNFSDGRKGSRGPSVDRRDDHNRRRAATAPAVRRKWR